MKTEIEIEFYEKFLVKDGAEFSGSITPDDVLYWVNEKLNEKDQALIDVVKTKINEHHKILETNGLSESSKYLNSGIVVAYNDVLLILK